MRNKFSTAIVFLALSGVGRGQTPMPVPPPLPPPPAASGPKLTLTDAVALAIKNHPQVAAARDVALETGQHVVEAKASYYPSVAGEVTTSQGLFGSRLGAGALSTSRLFDRAGQGMQLSQLVTDFGRRSNLVANSRFLAQAADQTTQATIYDVVFAVNKAYFGVLEAGAYVQVAQQTVNARQSLSDQVVALANANLKSQVDVEFAGVNLSQAKLMLIRAQDALKRAYADLARALGADNAVDYQLQAEPNAPTPPDSDAPLVAEAIQNRPELRELRLRLQAAQRFEDAERDLKHPTVSVIAAAGVLPYINNPTSTSIPWGYEGIGVNVEIPIFNGHLFSARAQAAHYESQAEDQRLRNQQQMIERDVREAWIAASTAYQSIPVTVQYLREAQLALELANGRYGLGLSSIVELTQAQLNLTQAQIENVNAQYDYQSAYAGLQYTIGALR
jgi:outer membrane protein